MHDFIGDIHGYATKLETLLTKLGYLKINGVYKHPTRTAVFVGDYIDRGPEIRETLHIVRSMVEAGNAIALMGNHEYNAIAYAAEDGKGGFLRSHNATHNKQHEQTLLQFADHDDEWQSHLQWFYTLPLFYEGEGFRAVHACWDEANIAWLKTNDHHTADEQLLQDAHIKGSDAHRVIEETLKGKEFNIPEGYTWLDKDGHARNENRIKWWMQKENCSYGDFLFNCPPALTTQPLPSELNISVYPHDAPPVFFGHYWLEDKFPIIQSHNVVCLDYSVAKGGNLVGYRWAGERELSKSKFEEVRE